MKSRRKTNKQGEIATISTYICIKILVHVKNNNIKSTAKGGMELPNIN